MKKIFILTTMALFWTWLSFSQTDTFVIFYDNFDWAPGDNTAGANLMTSTAGERHYPTWTTEPVLSNPGWTSTSASDGVAGTPTTAAWLYTRKGFLKLGKTSTDGDLITPALSKIQGTQDIVVSFKAAAYSGTEAGKSLRILISAGTGTFASSGTNLVTVNPLNAWEDTWLTDPKFHYSFKIKGATAATKIRFITGADNTVGGQVTTNRVGIDEVRIVLDSNLLLDVKFKNDGTAEDVSPLNNVITSYQNKPLVTTYNATFGDYTARFHHDAGTVKKFDAYPSPGSYRINYDNSAMMKDGLADGHSFEVFFTVKNFPALGTDEMKLLSCTQTGGSSLVLGTEDARNNRISFIAYTTGAPASPGPVNDYRWADSGIRPELNRWYHVVGVYDKSAAQVRIYIDGELKHSDSAPGTYGHPGVGYQWFAVGGDPGNGQVESLHQGDIAIARVHDKALTATEVKALYNKIKVPANIDILINGIDYPTGTAAGTNGILLEGDTYTITGTGFAAGDKIRFYSVEGSKEYLCNGTLTGTTGIQVTIPAGFHTDRYRIAVVRGSKQYDLGFADLGGVPTADLLDVVFKPNGLAEDVSQLKNPVTTYEKQMMLTYYNETLDKYVARFHHYNPDGNHPTLGANSMGGYYRVDYHDATNPKHIAIRNGLADGHSFEVLFTQKKESTDAMKMFSSMETGGTGFQINASSNAEAPGGLGFISFTRVPGSTGGGANGAYVNGFSKIKPTKDEWYHAVGVFDKDAGQVRIYIDGNLITDPASGLIPAGRVYDHPNSIDAYWIAIGGDAGPQFCQSVWQGDVAIARIYDKALSNREVTALYNEVKYMKDYPNTDISVIDVTINTTGNGGGYIAEADYDKFNVISAAKTLTITGDGFTAGDQIRFYSASGHKDEIYPLENITVAGGTVDIPAGFPSGKYRYALVRNDKQYDLGFINVEGEPVADLLDVVFHDDGTAEDISPLQNTVITMEGQPMVTTWNEDFGDYTARFHHNQNRTLSLLSGGYWQIKYDENDIFKNGLEDGHTIETLFTLKQYWPTSAEMKMFSSMGNGGTGFLIGNNSRNNQIIYLPHAGQDGQDGYRWTLSDTKPIEDKWYHVVGVYDKRGEKTQIYLNGTPISGEGTQTVPVTNNYSHPNDVILQWFGIGGDPGNNYLEAPWRGDVAIARVYDKALSGTEVSNLYSKVSAKNLPDIDMQINGINYLSGIEVIKGRKFTIYGTGFQSGDQIYFSAVPEPNLAPANPFSPAPIFGTIYYGGNPEVSSTNIKVTIPSDFVSGRYRISVTRGLKHYDLGFVRLITPSEPYMLPRIICHRGYHNGTGAPQNSIASLIAAQNLKKGSPIYDEMIYGSEFDVYITSDGVVVLHHDATICGLTIANSTYDQIRNCTLSDGVTPIPTFEAFLKEGKYCPDLKLICEIKSHGSTARNNAAVDAVVNLVEAAGMQDQVEYISFDMEICQRLKQWAPYAIIGFLSDETRTPIAPEDLDKDGLPYADYRYDTWRANPGWISKARELGMLSNVWTIDSQVDIKEFFLKGIDFITTDNPVNAKDTFFGIITSIEAPAVNMKALSVNGNLLFNVEYPASVKIYTVTGVQLAQLNVEKEASIALPQGIYIIKSVSKDIIETIKIINN